MRLSKLARGAAMLAARIGHVCMDFAPESVCIYPYACSKRRGHKGPHCAHVPVEIDGRVVLRSRLTWKRGAR